MAAEAGAEILRADFGREVAGLLHGAHVDLGMLVEIAVERSGSGFAGSHDEKVRRRRIAQGNWGRADLSVLAIHSLCGRREISSAFTSLSTSYSTRRIDG